MLHIPEHEKTAGAHPEQGKEESQWQECEDVEEGIYTLEEAVCHKLKQEVLEYINTLEEAACHKLKQKVVEMLQNTISTLICNAYKLATNHSMMVTTQK